MLLRKYHILKQRTKSSAAATCQAVSRGLVLMAPERSRGLRGEGGRGGRGIDLTQASRRIYSRVLG